MSAILFKKKMLEYDTVINDFNWMEIHRLASVYAGFDLRDLGVAIAYEEGKIYLAALD